jgi:hypothetical protein
MARQIGGVIGVAVVVAILGPTAGLPAFRAGWAFMAVAALTAGAAAARRPAGAPALRPIDATREVT